LIIVMRLIDYLWVNNVSMDLVIYLIYYSLLCGFRIIYRNTSDP